MLLSDLLQIKNHMNKVDLGINREKESELIIFRDTFTRLYGKLYNFSNYYLSYKEEAKEVVQEVFLKLWEGKYDIILLHEEKKIDSVLFTMTRNKCLDIIKHRKVEHKFSETNRDENIRNSINIHALKDDSSLDFLINNDTEKAIKKAIMELPEYVRETFIMSRYHGLTYKEIATKQSVSERTVEYRISYALKELRVKLSPYYYVMFILFFR